MVNYDKRILVCCPFNNEAHSMKLFMKSLVKIDYPRELIDLVLFENNSTDATWERLVRHHRRLKKLNWHSVTLYRKTDGELFPKLKHRDFAKPLLVRKRGKKAQLMPPIYSGKHLVWGKQVFARAKNVRNMYYFLFNLLKPEHDFFMMMMTDMMYPPNILKRYVEVMEKFSDAGWVGGCHHRRFPTHTIIAAPYIFAKHPIKRTLKYISVYQNVREPTPLEIIMARRKSGLIFEVFMTGHGFMLRPEIVKRYGQNIDTVSQIEIVTPIITSMWKAGYKVYCASDIYQKHISLDGKVYVHELFSMKNKKALLHHWEKSLSEGIANKDRLAKKIKIKTPTTPEHYAKTYFSQEVQEQLKEKVEEYEEEIEFEGYRKFVTTCLRHNSQIPDRPKSDTGTVFDRMSNRSLTAKDWDAIYGRWRKFIENPQKYQVKSEKDDDTFVKVDEK